MVAATRHVSVAELLRRERAGEYRPGSVVPGLDGREPDDGDVPAETAARASAGPQRAAGYEGVQAWIARREAERAFRQAVDAGIVMGPAEEGAFRRSLQALDAAVVGYWLIVDHLELQKNFGDGYTLCIETAVRDGVRTSLRCTLRLSDVQRRAFALVLMEGGGIVPFEGVADDTGAGSAGGGDLSRDRGGG
jgi:hypothetical protein